MSQKSTSVSGADTGRGLRPDTATEPGVATRAARVAVWLLIATIVYNIAEGIIAIAAGLAAGSVALTGFGFDSGIEVVAAAIVLHRLRADVRHGEVDEDKERRALKAVAVTFFVLATYVTVEGIRDLIVGATPETSIVGIVLTGASVIIMPLLARYKRINGERMGSALVIADAAETKLCSWLSVSTLAGLGAYAVLGWGWIDAVAGFVIAYFAIREGREAWEGELVCGDDCDDEAGPSSQEGSGAACSGGSCAEDAGAGAAGSGSGTTQAEPDTESATRGRG